MISGLEHTALSVSDLERSIAFYRDVMELELVRIIECPPEMRLGDVAGMPGCTARIAHLRSGRNMLELFEYQDPRGKDIPKGQKQADLGLIHLGFTSTDVRSDYAKLKELGIKVFSEPIEFRPGVWIFYFFGPDGEVCELRQT
ncbi:MAG: VOC family protein [Phycisphaerae bacterium]|nr:VOC family protein [Phycisphaerae bacterium]